MSRGEMLDDLLARSELAGHLQPSGKQKLSLPNIGALYAEHFESLAPKQVKPAGFPCNAAANTSAVATGQLKHDKP
ncbi:hypothetical protein ACVWZ6_009012 [Bradyrhizobium sp. GM6.1]